MTKRPDIKCYLMVFSSFLLINEVYIKGSPCLVLYSAVRKIKQFTYLKSLNRNAIFISIPKQTKQMYYLKDEVSGIIRQRLKKYNICPHSPVYQQMSPQLCVSDTIRGKLNNARMQLF